MAEDCQYDDSMDHSAKDKAVMWPLAERLQADGLRVWCDELVVRPTRIEKGLNVI